MKPEPLRTYLKKKRGRQAQMARSLGMTMQCLGKKALRGWVIRSTKKGVYIYNPRFYLKLPKGVSHEKES